MFYTLTANPAVDMTVSSSPLEPDENVRTGSASYTANGKGLDVSFAFKKMGVDTVARGFFAVFTGKFIVEEVMNLGCLCRPVWTDGITLGVPDVLAVGEVSVAAATTEIGRETSRER